MGGIVYTRGGPQHIIERIRVLEPELNADADRIIAETLAEAKELQIEELRAAVTPTGEDRMRRGVGNGPGRDDTGELILDVHTEQTAEGGKHIGTYGFFDPREKEISQERTAHSVALSFITVRENFFARVNRATTKGF